MAERKPDVLEMLEDLRGLGLEYHQIANRMYSRGYYVRSAAIKRWHLSQRKPTPKMLEGLATVHAWAMKSKVERMVE